MNLIEASHLPVIILGEICECLCFVLGIDWCVLGFHLGYSSCLVESLQGLFKYMLLLSITYSCCAYQGRLF